MLTDLGAIPSLYPAAETCAGPALWCQPGPCRQPGLWLLGNPTCLGGTTLPGITMGGPVCLILGTALMADVIESQKICIMLGLFIVNATMKLCVLENPGCTQCFSGRFTS